MELDLVPGTGNIKITFPYDPGLVSRVHTIPSVKWHADLKFWECPPQFLLNVLTVFPGFTRLPAFQDLYNRYNLSEDKIHTTLEEAVKTFPLTYVLVGSGKVLFNHQLDAAKEILTQRRLILAHEMGLGKTITSLVAAKSSGLPVYVIAPRSLHKVWEREARDVGLMIHTPISWATIPDPPKSEFFLIVDEAHLGQSLHSKRTKKFLAFAGPAKLVVLVTGTPVKNGRPSNLFPLLFAIKHPIALSKKDYEREFCGAKATRFSRWDTSGASNLDKLYELTKNQILRKTKDECLDLPDKIRVLRAAELDKEGKATYDMVFQMLRDKWQYRIATNQTMAINEKLAMLTQLRHAASWGKLNTARSLAEEFKENNRKAVFFTAYQDSAAGLHNQLSQFSQAGGIWGSLSQANRQTAIDEFQEGKSDFIVSTLGAGGLGITLTAADTVILVDRPWTPGDAFQAEDRVHRIGQTNTVTSIWLQCNSSDEYVDNLLLSKQRNISRMLTGDPFKEDLTFDISAEIDAIFNNLFEE